MYWLVFLRYFLGLVSRNSALSRPLRAIWKGVRTPYPTGRAAPHGVVPHDEWIRMVYVLSESCPAAGRGIPRGTLERPTHPLSSMLRFARRLAGVPMPYPALAATVCLANRQSGRARP